MAGQGPGSASVTLAEVISSFTPMTVSGREWRGACPKCGGELAVIENRWRCVCSAQDIGDDAAGFLMFAEGLTRPEAEAALTNGRTWTPALIVPPRQLPKWGLHRVADDPRPVLIVDTREAAKAAEAKLGGYLTVLWPGGGSRWDGLEPLRGKVVLLWPSIEGLAHMERLEAVLVDPAGLGCTGSFIVPSDLAPWDADTDTLIKWAKERKRPLTNQQQQVSSYPSLGLADQPELSGNAAPEAPLPPALASPADAGFEGPPSDAEPPPTTESDFPPEALSEPPRKPQLPEPYAGEALGKPAKAPDWEVILERTKAGPLNNLDNVVRVIENDPTIRGHIWYDEFLDSICSDWQDPSRRWRDSDDVLLQLYVQRHVGLQKVGIATVHDAALVAAFRNVRNECREWLSALQWDGTERLSHVLADAFGAEQSVYAQAVGRCWFISMVARVMEPGCKVDTVPVLEGAQGVGKSSALKIIGGKWFAECHESVLNKDWYGVLDGHMLVEISEMHSFTRGEVERVKGLISCQVDRYRKAYGRNTEDHARQSVLVCTTNRDDWQRDDTGARRFWPVLCGTLDLEWLRTNRENLFAEAVHLYRAGVSWWNVPETDQEAELEKRRDADAWEHAVSEWLTGRGKVTTSEVLDNCLSIALADQEVTYQRRVARVLRTLGWKQHVLRENGVNRRTWQKHP